MEQIDLSKSSKSSVSHSTSKSFLSHLEMPQPSTKQQKEVTDIDLFKILMINQIEKAEHLEENVSFLQKEIEAKNKTIEKLSNFR